MYGKIFFSMGNNVSCYLYRFWVDEDIVYVGISGELSTRIQQHKCGSSWYGSTTKVDYIIVPNRSVARILELYFIESLKPIYNLADKSSASVACLSISLDSGYQWQEYKRENPVEVDEDYGLQNSEYIATVHRFRTEVVDIIFRGSDELYVSWRFDKLILLDLFYSKTGLGLKTKNLNLVKSAKRHGNHVDITFDTKVERGTEEYYWLDLLVKALGV